MSGTEMSITYFALLFLAIVIVTRIRKSRRRERSESQKVEASDNKPSSTSETFGVDIMILEGEKREQSLKADREEYRKKYVPLLQQTVLPVLEEAALELRQNGINAKASYLEISEDNKSATLLLTAWSNISIYCSLRVALDRYANDELCAISEAEDPIAKTRALVAKFLKEVDLAYYKKNS